MFSNRDNKAFLVRWAHKARKATREILAFAGLQGLMESWEQRATWDHLARQVNQEKMATKARQDHLARRELEDRKANKDLLDLLGRKDRPVKMDCLARRAKEENQANLVCKARKVKKVLWD